MIDCLKRFKALTLKLHSLQMEDKDDSDTADAVRDELDVYWHEMTPADKAEAGAYSEWLYDSVVRTGGVA